MSDDSGLEIVGMLGKGGTASVYKARIQTGRGPSVVAVKRLHDFLRWDTGCVEALMDEVRIGRRIKHPNVVRVLGMLADEAPSVVMEYVDGVDLATLMRSAREAERRLPLDVTAAIVRDVLAGLHAAHETRGRDGASLGIVHRDVSPQNVLVGFDGSARVTDFGVAKASCRVQETRQDAVKGKLGYLAPEQLEARCDRRTDVFAVGAMLWELLTGTRMRGEGVDALVQIVSGAVERPSRIASEARGLDDVVLCALAYSADDRYATAQEMQDALLAAVTPASRERVTTVVREVLALATACSALGPSTARREWNGTRSSEIRMRSITMLSPVWNADLAPPTERSGEHAAFVEETLRMIDAPARQVG